MSEDTPSVFLVQGLGYDSPPSSPQQQSDSDGSISSGESGLHAQVAPVKCRWRLCGEWFGQLELLAAHVTHTHALPGRSGLFYCGWEGCSRGDRGFNARYKMLVHVRTHTNEKPHHCYQCDKSFSRAENLKIHSRSHTGERPYVCPVVGCGKAYSNSSDRFKHTRTHSVDKPYVCKVPGCPKRYTDPSSLRKHVKTYRHFPPTTNPETNCKLEMEVEVGEEEKKTREADVPLQLVNYPSERAWPGLLYWYDWASRTPYTCSEQETPLDLTLPVKLHNRV